MILEPEAALEESVSVFSGKVREINPKTLSSQEETLWLQDAELWYYVSFDISTAYKWENTEEISIFTAQDSASCWYQFVEWQDYIVYTYGEVGNESTSICSRTKNIQDADDDIRALEMIHWSWALSSNDDVWLQKISTQEDMVAWSGETNTGTLNSIENALELDKTLYFYIFGILILLSWVWFIYSQKLISKDINTQNSWK